jgi:hypothetical protein
VDPTPEVLTGVDGLSAVAVAGDDGFRVPPLDAFLLQSVPSG